MARRAAGPTGRMGVVDAMNRTAVAELLRIGNAARSCRELIGELEKYFSRVTGCQEVAILPGREIGSLHGAHRDLPDDPTLFRICTEILLGGKGPTHPLLTANGTFWTNTSAPLRARASAGERSPVVPYESIALIPIQLEDRIFGLLQLYDPRKGVLSKRIIQQLERMAGFAAGVFGRLKAEECLRAREKVLEAIMNAAPDGVALLDKEGRVLAVNHMMAAWLRGEAREAAGGAEKVHPVPPGLDVIGRDQLDAVFQTRLPLRVEDARDGRWFENSLYPILSHSGEVETVVAFSRDVTEQRRTRDELRIAAEELRRKGIELRNLAGRIAEGEKTLEQRVQENVRRQILPLVQQVRVMTGKADSFLADLLTGLLKRLAVKETPALPDGLPPLSARETEIVTLIAEGKSTKEISSSLRISPRSVETHRYHIRGKLGLRKKGVSLLAWLRLQQRGLGPPSLQG